MIELPRAALRADEIAAEADFFSFGTNDLTQTTLGFSRDDAEGKFLTYYLEHGILERNPFEVIDEDGVGDLMRIAVERGRARSRGSSWGSAASTEASRARSRSAIGSGSTTSPARRTACRSRGSPPRRRRSPRRVSPRSRSAASRPGLNGEADAQDAHGGHREASRAQASA